MNASSSRLAFLVVSPLAFALALFLVRRFVQSPGDPDTYWDDGLRREVQAVVQNRYVDPIDEREARRLFEGALQGYVASLDPYSRYVPPEEKGRVDEETQGVFGGIGIRALAVPGGLRVSAVRDDAPAHRAGLLPGDVLEVADGTPLAGRDLDDMLTLIRGVPGTHVVLSVRRTDELLTVDVVRGEVPTDTVQSVRMLPGEPAVGYLRVEQFADTTAVEVRDAVARLVRDGAKAFVLDLRQNLGGVVTAADGVAGMFLPEGTPVCIARRRDPSAGQIHVATPPDGGTAVAAPLVVLVDESTASASEILAGALQDHGRAVLVGERTWGKFLVQSLVPVGEDSLVRITTARYETPRGRSAPRTEADAFSSGLAPDVHVPVLSRTERARLYASLARQLGPRWRGAPPEEETPVEDRALDVAAALLRGAPPPAETVEPRRM